jgi:hypothetical protein
VIVPMASLGSSAERSVAASSRSGAAPRFAWP